MKSEQMDAIDRRILEEMRTDCRRSYRQLAEAVGLSPASLMERVKKLEKGGYVKGYSARLDFLRLGYEFMAIVQISISHGSLLDAQEKIARLPGVAAVYDVTGQYDSIAILMCKSRSELSALVKRILAVPHVEKTNTNMVLNVVKETDEFRGV
jgi:DNA-binding Lrp family transcriptional regulator